MNKQPSVTIGIPAYNEAANIGYLLNDIASQKIEGFTLERVIVVSDGSTDETTSIVKAAQDSRIVLIDDGERKGQASRQNEIIALTNSDILVLLNADISLQGNQCISLLIMPLLEGRADFVSCNTRVVKPKGFFEKVLELSEQWKRHMIGHWQNGGNLYTCKGYTRAFSRAYYKKIVFPKRIGEDAYSYLFGIVSNFRYQYVPEAVILIKLPDTFKDHVKQSHRFLQSQRVSSQDFGEAFVRAQYRIPCLQILRSSLLFFLTHPILFVGYLGVYFLTVWQSYFSRPISDTWDISITSKKLK